MIILYTAFLSILLSLLMDIELSFSTKNVHLKSDNLYASSIINYNNVIYG